MRHAIIACSDQKCENFLIHDWMKSLVANVNLANIDVIVLDYGLSPSVCTQLIHQGAIIHPFRKDGAVSTQRMKDIAGIIQQADYDQVMICDAGDLIFQADISHLFEQDKDTYRAVCMAMMQPYVIYLLASMARQDVRRIRKLIKGKPVINCGVVIAPKQKILALLEESRAMIQHNMWGAEQPVVNYVLYRDGFNELPCGYNFAIATSVTPFYISQGKFFFRDGNLIPVVHNIGRLKSFRPISNFGYGERKNQLKPIRYYPLRLWYWFMHILSYILD